MLSCVTGNLSSMASSPINAVAALLICVSPYRLGTGSVSQLHFDERKDQDSVPSVENEKS